MENKVSEENKISEKNRISETVLLDCFFNSSIGCIELLLRHCNN